MLLGNSAATPTSARSNKHYFCHAHSIPAHSSVPFQLVWVELCRGARLNWNEVDGDGSASELLARVVFCGHTERGRWAGMEGEEFPVP